MVEPLFQNGRKSNIWSKAPLNADFHLRLFLNFKTAASRKKSVISANITNIKIETIPMYYFNRQSGFVKETFA